jgi:amino acid transporter
MKMMSILTVIKLAILALIAIVGLLVLAKAIPSDADAGLNLSFYGTSSSPGSYATAIYFVMQYINIKNNQG